MKHSYSKQVNINNINIKMSLHKKYVKKKGPLGYNYHCIIYDKETMIRTGVDRDSVTSQDLEAFMGGK